MSFFPKYEDWLRANIAKVEALLSERTEAEDPSGVFQYRSMLRHLKEELELIRVNE